ncbi:hypothetical protein DYB37_013456, partial [Aphanomyces astaci]
PRRGKGWCPASTELMLDKIELFLPAGRNGWAKVADAYNPDGKAFPKRDIDSLRRKFATLKNHAKPTGHPECPPDSLDKFIAGAVEADAKSSSDFMSMMMIMEARSTEREEQRHIREMEWRAEERVRQVRRDELHMMLMAKLFDSKHK